MSQEIPSAAQEQLDAVKQAMEAKQAEAEVQPEVEPAEEPVATVVEPEPAPTEDPKPELALGKTTQVDPQTAEEEDWKHKYDVLNGMFRKETGDLREQNQNMAAELEKVKAEVAKVPLTAESISDEAVREMIPKDQIEEYGMEYWKGHLFAYQQVAEKAQDTPKIQNLEKQMATQRRDAYYDQLAVGVPEWEKINNSPEWIAFLDKVEPLTGVKYEDLLMDAHDSFNVERTKNVFDAFGATSSTKPTGFDTLATPKAKAPVAPDAKKSTMTVKEWTAKMQAIPSLGLSQAGVEKKQNELRAMWKEGRVTHAP